MNDSDPVAPLRSEFGFSSLPAAVIGWLSEFSSPDVQSTVTAEAVKPSPVIWL